MKNIDQKSKGLDEGFETAIALIIFNRPALTKRVFEVIQQVRPKRLYLISDGARANREGETELVQACRNIVEAVDWPCEVKKNYAQHNVSCGIRIASGIHWVFRHEERAIILEDDLLPDLSFFPFCETLLSKYQDCPQVMHINGRNNLGDWGEEADYFFSRTANPWGWATWRRAWQHFEFLQVRWQPENREFYRQLLDDPEQAEFYDYNEKKYQGRITDTWDIQWTYNVFWQMGLTISPRLNLVQNSGFDEWATHTHNTLDVRQDHPVFSFSENLKHPQNIDYQEVGKKFDRWNFLMEQLNGFKNPPVLMTLKKMLDASDDPVLREKYRDYLPFLMPLNNRQESRSVLLHVQRHLPENRFWQNVLKYFP